jgi:hypothetical protein
MKKHIVTFFIISITSFILTGCDSSSSSPVTQNDSDQIISSEIAEGNSIMEEVTIPVRTDINSPPLEETPENGSNNSKTSSPSEQIDSPDEVRESYVRLLMVKQRLNSPITIAVDQEYDWYVAEADKALDHVEEALKRKSFGKVKSDGDLCSVLAVTANSATFGALGLIMQNPALMFARRESSNWSSKAERRSRVAMKKCESIHNKQVKQGLREKGKASSPMEFLLGNTGN